MAPENSKWLSFTLSPAELLTSSQVPQPHHYHTSLSPVDHSHQYYLDNFFGWENAKAEGVYGDDEAQAKEVIIGQSIGDTSSFCQAYFDTQINQPTLPIPKLEDFLGGDSALMRYSDHSQTDTQDSSLTHIYDQHTASAYFSDPNPNEYNALTCTNTGTVGFQAFSANSGSEVEDSGSASRAQMTSQSIESGNEVVYAQRTPGGLTLGVKANDAPNVEKAIVPVETESCKKITDTFGQRTSIYRGVTRHRWTGRYEAHLWDNSCRREGQARKGRQVYLGGYDKEDKAARAYDLAALKYWGPTATTNFPVSNYSKELEEMKNVTKQEFIASLRRKSSGFSRGASIYRGVTRHHQQGRWQARIGRVAGNKDLYLGTFATEEEAAEAYDIAAIKFRGMNAVTNFEMNRYDVEAIMKSSLPIGGAAKRLKLSLEAEQKPSLTYEPQGQNGASTTCIDFSNVQTLANLPSGVPFDPSTRYHPNLFNFHTNNAVSDPSTAGSPIVAAPMNFLPSSSEFFLWPHQSY